MELMDHRGRKVLKAILVKLDQQVQMVKMEIQVYKDHKVTKGLSDHKVLKVHRVTLDHKVKLD